MTDTKKLKELAEKLAPAYQGPWESHRHSASAVTVGAVGEDGEYSDFIDVRISDYSAFDEHDDELGQWIAAANPKTILALLDEIDRLKAENEAVLAANRDCIDWFNQIKTEYDECASTIPGVYYMDPPDGGDVSVPEQLRRMARDAARYRWLRDSCTRQWDVMYRDIEVVIKGDGADDCEDLDGIIDAALEGATQ
ncbi:ead/Ea22-like family protein [Pseudomonas aeruginosa]